jgi:hypothetical protein
MKTNSGVNLIMVFLIILLSCKKNCEEIIIDRNVKITVINTTNSEDISSTLDSDNFIISGRNIPGQVPFFAMEFGKSPIDAIVPFYPYSCNKSSPDKFSFEYNIKKENKIIGGIKVDFIKIKNECNDCKYFIENFHLLELSGEVILQEGNNQLTLFVEE